MNLGKRLIPGSYVVAYFPSVENPTQPGEKCHPCLVLDPAAFGLGENVAVLLPSTRDAGDPHNYINVRGSVTGIHIPRDARKGPFVNIHHPVAISLEEPGRGAFFNRLDAIGAMNADFFEIIQKRVLESGIPVDTSPLGFKLEGSLKRPLPDLSARPEPGSYVLCRFPYSDNGWEPGGKLRPSLVMGYDQEYGFDPPVAILAFSSSGESKVQQSYVEVREWVSDLDIPHKHGPYINIRNIRAVPITRDFFPKGMQKIGALSEEGFAVIKGLTNRYNAYPNAAAVDFANFVKANPLPVSFRNTAAEVESQFASVQNALRPDESGFINIFGAKPDDNDPS